MKNSIRFIEVSGSPYERGKAAGRMFKDSLGLITPKYLKMLKTPALYQQMNRVRKKVINTFPSYYQEICGRADGADICQDTYFLMMCAEILGEGTGCTSVVYKRPNGSILLAHNEDDNFTIENSCITKCSTESGWFVTSDFHTMPFGNGFSWNSHGIIKIINYCRPVKINPEGIPRYLAQRHISEARSIPDFIERCSLPDRASGYHAIVLDTNTHTAVSVEVTADSISIQDIHDVYSHTNHYIHQQIYSEKSLEEAGSTSSFRLNKAHRLLNEAISDKVNNLGINDVIKILQYRGHSFQDSILAVPGDPYVTFATFAIDTAEKQTIQINFYITKENIQINY
ncbi:MAG: C45 family autoproteolytic acyltransferase/hydrolase, partial [Clostridia bacterium]